RHFALLLDALTRCLCGTYSLRLRHSGLRSDWWKRSDSSAILGIEDGLAEIAGKRRAETRYLRIVARARSKTVGDRHCFGSKQLIRPCLRDRLQGVNQRAANQCQSSGAGDADGFAREADDARSLSA
ncbi:MAG TPA: hypothetical protein DD795_04535, partial [Erythrobacter sp.]|nr:hypothetical protein [Erythrobacter sp.]